MDAINAGDVVRRKNSSVAMTVETVIGTDCVCVWFDETISLRHGNFALSDLEKGEWKRAA